MLSLILKMSGKVIKRLSPIIKSDSIYLSLRYYCIFRKKLNLKNPVTFNEKLQWLKINDRKPIYTDMVDKIEAKKYVAKRIGQEHIIPTIAEYNSVDEINWDTLPNKFVIKCTHDSGGILVCKDKNNLDIEAAKRKFRKGLKKTYFNETREWPYKNCKHRLICEEYMTDESGYDLKDYKWFCFNGKVKALFIAKDRGSKDEETKFDFYDADFNHLPIKNGHPNANQFIEKPKGFEEMKRLAEELSKGFPHLRVDFYDINGRIYFGELTFFHWSGLMPFEPEEWDYKFGEWIDLPLK